MSVLLETSVGDIVIDVYTAACPKSAMNFLKLCKLKYYNGVIFHHITPGFVAASGDPTGTGRGGSSVYGLMYGDAATCFEHEINPQLKHEKRGVVGLIPKLRRQSSSFLDVDDGNVDAEDLGPINASQFYITLGDNLNSLDGKHSIFGEVGEGLYILDRLNEVGAFTDTDNRPVRPVRILHTIVLDDPFPDPPPLLPLLPLASPAFNEKELEDDWTLAELLSKGTGPVDTDIIEHNLKEKKAKTSAVILEMMGDLPDADVKPPENVLFVCKLNPVTRDEDLELLFSRFGKILSCSVIRDFKSGDSLCYAFIEFEEIQACEAAYFKMDNVLVDDRRIHVDFSQSVAKLWNNFHVGRPSAYDGSARTGRGGRGRGGGVSRPTDHNCPIPKSHMGRGSHAPFNRQVGGLHRPSGTKYDMVFSSNDKEDKDGRPINVADIIAIAKSRAGQAMQTSDANTDNRQLNNDEGSSESSDDSGSHRRRERKEGSRRHHRHRQHSSSGDHSRRKKRRHRDRN